MEGDHNAPVRVLIVDDERLGRERVRTLLAKRTDVEVVGEGATGLEALAAISALRPELVFLDVQMPDLDGLGVVEALDGVDRAGRREEIIFVTAHNAYMEQAFEAHALDYLRKPYTNARFYSALDEGRRRVLAGRRERGVDAAEQPAPEVEIARGESIGSRIVVQERRTGTWHIVLTDEIDWIEADGNHVRLHKGKISHEWRRSLQEIERQLSGRDFMRVHRSFIVNTARIRSVKPLQKGEFALVLEGGAVVDTGRTYRDAIEQFLQRL